MEYTEATIELGLEGMTHERGRELLQNLDTVILIHPHAAVEIMGLLDMLCEGGFYGNTSSLDDDIMCARSVNEAASKIESYQHQTLLEMQASNKKEAAKEARKKKATKKKATKKKAKVAK